MNTPLELKSGKWLLVVGPHTTVPTVLRMIGRLAESGPVNVVDGGFAFNPYIVNSGNRAGLPALNRIRVHKAYSSREMLAALEGLASEPRGSEMADGDVSQKSPRPACTPTPFVVLDFLATFFYFFEALEERKSVLRLCLSQLNRLEKGTCGLVSVHLPRVLSQSEAELLALVTGACQDIQPVELMPAVPMPARIF